MPSVPASSRSRITVLGGVAVLWLLVLLARLVDLQVLRHSELSRRVERQQQRTLEVTPKRGVIYDRNHRALAVSLAVDSAFAVPGEVSDPARTARLLSPLLREDGTELEGRLRSSRSFTWLKRKLDPGVAERVRVLDLPGIYFEREHKRFYPKRELAAHVLGFVGVDEDGLAGIEYAFEELIRGPSRRLLITADGRRRPYGRQGRGAPEGTSLSLTLDENIQYIAERELTAAIRRTGARAGSIIVQQPATGEILAMANHPTFDPNRATAVPTFYHVNRSLSLAYEPGSTFKIITVAAALEDGLARPTELIDCQQGGILLAGHLIRDHKPFGVLSVREIIHESSDVGAIKLGLRLGEDRMYDYIRQWRFGQTTGIELPAESRGLLRPPESWSRVSIGAISMGQEMAITPLQLTAAISAIANGGVWVRPHVVRGVLQDGEVVPVSSVQQERIIEEGVAEELRRMLAGVVTQGTGTRALPAGYSAAGKTGTAQKIDDTGSYSKTDFVPSFAGFAPLMEPAITVVVVLDSPQGEEHEGGEVAAPVFRAVTEQVLAYLNIPQDVRLEPERTAVPSRASADIREETRTQSRRHLPGQPGPAVSSAFWVVSEEPSADGVRRLAASRQATLAESVVTLNGDSVEVPNFVGVSMRRVVEECARLGLQPVLVGSGIAVGQNLQPRTRVPRGSTIRVEFGASLPAIPSRPL